MTSLPSRLARHVARARLFREPGGAVVAVSGGADSVALLDLLSTLAPTLGLTLVVAHVDHGIAADSRTVGRAVLELAARYGLEFELGELHLGPKATETAARAGRYAWLRDVQRRRGARYLVTAHHQDDQIETIVLRLLRGSAPAGLAGIAARARGGLVRPLLPFAKAELAAHTASRGLPVHDDSANSDPRHLRSWVRTVLLPLLAERLCARVGQDVLRAGARQVREVVANEDRGAVDFGEFRVSWRPGSAPERLQRSGWTTWMSEAGWELRHLRPGDRLVPLGGVGRRPVRRMLMEARVPRGDRAGYPVVARGETILWVPGVCRSAADLPQPGTRAVRVDVTKHGGSQANRRA